MKMSTSIGELAKALAKAQTSYNALVKDSSNPFFKSKYADLAACIECTRDPLASNGLSVIQSTDIVLSAQGQTTVVETTLLHTSGEWISGSYPLTPTKQDAQGYGAALTYARRYALTAMLGIAAEDDDGETAVGRGLQPAVKAATPVKTPDGQKYSNTVYSEETIKRIGKLEKDGLKGKECLKAFLPEYTTKYKKNFTQISDLDDKTLNDLIRFIEDHAPKGM